MKQVHLTLIETTCGKDDRTIATVRATKHGKQAELQFVGETEKRRFPTVQKAWEWLCQTVYRENSSTYFERTEHAVH